MPTQTNFPPVLSAFSTKVSEVRVGITTGTATTAGAVTTGAVTTGAVTTGVTTGGVTTTAFKMTITGSLVIVVVIDPLVVAVPSITKEDPLIAYTTVPGTI